MNGKMVDKLKRSLEQLDPPNCSNCSIEMKWTRSTLIEATTIAHVFVCAGCSCTSKDQIHNQGDQYSTPEAIGTASLPRCLGRIREDTQPHLSAALAAGASDAVWLASGGSGCNCS